MNLSALPTHPALIIQAADVVDRLPAAAAADFQALRNDAQNAHAVLSSMTDRLQERRSEKRQAEGQRGQLLKLHRLEIDDPRVLAEDKKIDRLAASIAPLQQAYDKRAAEWQEISGLVSAIEKFCRALPAETKLLRYSGPEPKLGKNEDFAGAIERCRRRLRELHADKSKFSTAPILSVRAKEIIRTEIERHAELGRPDLAPVLDHGEPIRWPTAALNHLGRQRLDAAVGQADTFDGLAVLIWLFKPQLIDALEKEIDAIADDAAALSEADRDRLMAEVERDLLAVQRDEEFFIRQAANVARRRDAHPLAVLQLEM